jgi:hypothetical protein
MDDKLTFWEGLLVEKYTISKASEVDQIVEELLK